MEQVGLISLKIGGTGNCTFTPYIGENVEVLSVLMFVEKVWVRLLFITEEQVEVLSLMILVEKVWVL